MFKTNNPGNHRELVDVKGQYAGLTEKCHLNIVLIVYKFSKFPFFFRFIFLFFSDLFLILPPTWVDMFTKQVFSYYTLISTTFPNLYMIQLYLYLSLNPNRTCEIFGFSQLSFA